MIFQSGKYCDIVVRQRVEDGSESLYRVRIRDTGDTHLDIACTDLSHALELWTAIERSPEVKIVVDVSDYIVKDDPLSYITRGPLDEFADCRHRPIAKEDCDLREFDLEEMA